MGAQSATGTGPGGVPTPNTQSFQNKIGCSVLEVPTGTKDGVNPTFQITVATNMILLFKNGLLQTQNADFSLSGKTITFFSGNIPMSEDALLAYLICYRGD
jgi:hypothetical protein